MRHRPLCVRDQPDEIEFETDEKRKPADQWNQKIDPRPHAHQQYDEADLSVFIRQVQRIE
eukprot:COSAG02_NODE_46298_length_350_cov_0.617530_2_plen_59_part_01